MKEIKRRENNKSPKHQSNNKANKDKLQEERSRNKSLMDNLNKYYYFNLQHEVILNRSSVLSNFFTCKFTYYFQKTALYRFDSISNYTIYSFPNHSNITLMWYYCYWYSRSSCWSVDLQTPARFYQNCESFVH